MDLLRIVKGNLLHWSNKEILCFTIVLLVEIVILYYLKKHRRINKVQMIATVLESFAIAFVLGITLFTRTSSGVYKYEFRLFWSWKCIWKTHSRELLIENILNVLLFLPIGGILPFVFYRKVTWWKAGLFFLLLSVIIETGQLVMCRGLFEWDDMIHNSLGGLIGIWIANRICMGKYKEI